MTHEDLLEGVRSIVSDIPADYGQYELLNALEAVINLHKPQEAWGDTHCGFCFDLAWEPSGLEMGNKQFTYPCPTIQAIVGAMYDA